MGLIIIPCTCKRTWRHVTATKMPEDCICRAKGDPRAGRLLINGCPCCDGGLKLISVIFCDSCKNGTS